MKQRTHWIGFIILLLVTGSSCGQHEMQDGSKIKPYEEDPFFKDGSSARPLVKGTVARGHLKTDSPFYTGQTDGRYVPFCPIRVDRSTLERGQEQFNIYCAVCHSRTGDGDGMIVRRGFTQPPSFHIERLQKAPAGYLFNVASHGTVKMPAYSDVLDEQDRWAIVAYIKTLQRSRQADLQDAPDDIQRTLNNQSAGGEQPLSGSNGK